MKLYDISKSIALIWESAQAALDDEIATPEAKTAALAALETTLKEAEGTHADKCLNVACLIKNLESEADAVAVEEKKLQARRKASERHAEWLRSYLAGNMEPGTNLKDARAVIGWRKSMAVEVGCKPEELPETMQRVKVVVEADKSAIKSALETGQAVAGCALVQRFNIQIK